MLTGATWPPFFESLRESARYEILSLEVTAGVDVDFAQALFSYSTPEELATNPRSASG